MKNFASLLLGGLFGIGLGISGMTDPAKVTAFLDVSRNWDPSLLLVMGAAVGINFFAFRTILKRRQPKLDTSFHMPTQRRIDSKLVVGSILFGIGWGMSGYCPGAAVAAASSGATSVFLFLGTMIVGMQLYDRVWVPAANRSRSASRSVETASSIA